MYQLLITFLWLTVTIQSKHFIIETKNLTDEVKNDKENIKTENDVLTNAEENLEPESEFNVGGISHIDIKKGSETERKRAELLKIIDGNFGESEIVDIKNDPVTEEIGADFPNINKSGFEEEEDTVKVAVRPGRAGGGRAVFGGGSNCRNKKNRNQCKSKPDGTVCKRRQGKKYTGEGVCCDKCCRSTIKDKICLVKYKVIQNVV